MVAWKSYRQTPAVCLFSAWAVVRMAAVMASASDAQTPDRSNPDYIYCEDFEEGKVRDGIVFVHYHVKAPENFYLGRANHGDYLFDSEGGGPWVGARLSASFPAGNRGGDF